MGWGVHQRELVHIQALYHAGKRAYSAGPRTAPCAQSSRLKLRPWTTILQDEHAFLLNIHAEVSSFNITTRNAVTNAFTNTTCDLAIFSIFSNRRGTREGVLVELRARELYRDRTLWIRRV